MYEMDAVIFSFVSLHYILFYTYEWVFSWVIRKNEFEIQ